MISCIIVEDEPLAAEKLKGYISKIDYLELAAVFDNGADAIGYLQSKRPDLIFLDICMEELDGMQFMASVPNLPPVIITSAESQYALPGYEYNVSDYLLKPFGFDRFIKALNKVSEELDKQKQEAPDFIFVKTEYRIERIDLKDILFITGMKDYLAIRLADKIIMTLMSFPAILQLLPAFRFARVHKSYIVALDKIRSIERNRIHIGEELIPISEGYKDQFFELLRNGRHTV